MTHNNVLNAAAAGVRATASYNVNSRSEEKNIRNTSLFGGWNTSYSMEYVEYEWNTCVIQASGRSFGVRGIRIHIVGPASCATSARPRPSSDPTSDRPRPTPGISSISVRISVIFEVDPRFPHAGFRQ